MQREVNNLWTAPPIAAANQIKIDAKVAAALQILREAAASYAPVAFSSSFGVEDMVITDMICSEPMAIEIFTLDTGRLPTQTYDLFHRLKAHYGCDIQVYFPRYELVETFVNEHGINGFYDSVDQRKACCAARKVEPLQRALAGKKGWVSGLRSEQSPSRQAVEVVQYDEALALTKINPLAHWKEEEIWAYIQQRAVPYNALHDVGYPSIGCAPCTAAISADEDRRAGRWWWENMAQKECGLHVRPDGTLGRAK